MQVRRLILLLLCPLLLAIAPTNAGAQFWKKKQKKDEATVKVAKEKNAKEKAAKQKAAEKTAREKDKKKQEARTKLAKEKELRRKERKLRKERKKQKYKESKSSAYSRRRPVLEDDPTEEPLRPRTINYPLTIIKARYRIDLLVPLYLDELVKGRAVTFKGNIPDKAVAGMAFYQGVKLAADSLKKAGFSIDLYVHDIGSAGTTAAALASNGKLDGTDLIIGAVNTKDVATVAAYAKKKQVNFISALSASDAGVTGNEYFTLLQPTLRSHCEWIKGDLAKRFPAKKVVLIYRNASAAGENAYKYLTTEVPAKVKYEQLQSDNMPSEKQLKQVIDPAKPNIVVVPVLDIAYADSLLRLLATSYPTTHFEIYGMPTWSGIPALIRSKLFTNLTVNVAYPFNFKTSDSLCQYIDRAYKTAFTGKPSELVYRGYETLNWYAHLLRSYGTIFNQKYADNAAAPFSRFEVKAQWDKDDKLLYNENTHLFLSTYQGGLQVTQ